MVEEFLIGGLGPEPSKVLRELACGFPGWGKRPKRLPWYPLRQIELWASRTTIHELLALGLVEQWSGVKNGPYLVLTALGAALCGVELVEPAIGQPPEWIETAKRTRQLVDLCSSEPASEGAFPFPDREVVTPKPDRRTRRICVQPLRDKWTGQAIKLFSGPTGEGAGVPIMVENKDES